MKERDTEAAFKWIVGIFRKHSIPFQVSGGFAARLYGSDRELADIDFGIPDKNFEDILEEVKPYITHGPEHYVDDEWDLQLMTLKYEGQTIDIAGRDTVKIFDKEKQEWIPAHRDLTVSENREVYGIIVPVIPKDALIAYKKKINRDVDRFDVQALEG